jgi:hypothetical protein
VPFVPPSGDVFFPLASNAHSLLAGGPVNSVRARMKTASLLYGQVLLEAGSMTIEAGATGASAFRHPAGSGPPPAWQTSRARSRAQRAPFAISMARETTPGVPARGPYHTVLQSETMISWHPTLQPFGDELPVGCDWVVLGYPTDPAPEFLRLQDQWRRIDDRNEALERLVPEHFVRGRLVEHVTKDLTVGISGGWDVSVDRFHGRVIGARFASDGPFTDRGVALPILVPRVSDLSWEDVARIRRLRAITRLREVLREVEAEAYEVTRSGGDLEAAMHTAYTRKVARASEGVEGIRSVAATAAMELLVGSGSGYAVTGLALLGPLVGAGAAAAVMTGWHVRRIVRDRRQRAWIGVMDTINEAVVS